MKYLFLFPVPRSLFQNSKIQAFSSRGEKSLKYLAKAIAIHIKIWYNDSPFKTKIDFNCTEYACLVQDLKGKKKILSQVMAIFSKIPGVKVLSGKLHGGYCRKRLTSVERVWKDFFLIRIQLKFKICRKRYKRSLVIYPSDVYPYGRQTLDVVEITAELRYKRGMSWKNLEDELYQRYDFSLNRIKRMIKRVSLVFERLVTSKIISPFLNVATWICAKVKSFENLTFSYGEWMRSGLFCPEERIFTGDLFSP